MRSPSGFRVLQERSRALWEMKATYEGQNCSSGLSFNLSTLKNSTRLSVFPCPRPLLVFDLKTHRHRLPDLPTLYEIQLIQFLHDLRRSYRRANEMNVRGSSLSERCRRELNGGDSSSRGKVAEALVARSPREGEGKEEMSV